MVKYAVSTLCLPLSDAENKVDKIEEFLRTIEERLDTLKQEREELIEYQKWDKLRRCVEYCIFERDLKESERKLKEVRLSTSYFSKFGKEDFNIKSSWW